MFEAKQRILYGWVPGCCSQITDNFPRLSRCFNGKFHQKLWVESKFEVFTNFTIQMRNTSQSSSSSFEIKQEPEYFMYPDNHPETDQSSGYDSS